VSNTATGTLLLASLSSPEGCKDRSFRQLSAQFGTKSVTVNMGASVMGHRLQRKAKPTRDDRARVARCKTWRMIDDGRPGHAFPTCGESLAQKGHPASEVKVEPRGGGGERLTSLLPAVQPEEELKLSTPRVTPSFSSLDSTRLPSAITLDNLPAPEHFTREQLEGNDANMASLQSQGRKRLKYKEPPLFEASAIATATPVPDQQASRPQPEQPHTTPTSNPSATTTERFFTPPEVMRDANSLIHKSPSSATSDRKLNQNTDPAVDMRGKNKHREPKKSPHSLTEDEQEVVFRGRSVGRSNVTNDSWRWDPVLGTLVSNTSGTSYQPPLTTKASNAKLMEDPKPYAASKSRAEVVNSMWAKTAAKVTQQRDDWTSTTNNNDWSRQDDETTPATGGWDTGHPPYPSTNRLNAEPSQSKYQARAPAKSFNHNVKGRKPKESPWIKDSLIPKGDPRRHKIRWSSSESSSSDSNRASSGWGTRRKRNDNGADLADWAGGLGPASIDWDSRPKFRDHQSAAKIQKWVEQHKDSLKQVQGTKLTADGSNVPFTTMQSGEHLVALQDQGDVAPRYWFVAHLDSKSARFFWQEHIDPQDNDVKPLDEDDLKGATPWWEHYVDAEHSMLKVPEHPEETGIDPDDEDAEQRCARENDKGAANAGENRKAAEKAKKEAQRKRTLARREKAAKISETYGKSPSNVIKPGLNMFLRPATKEDMVQLRDLYNRYIDNAFVVPETERLTDADMLERWQAIKNAKLPFIVACQRGEVIKARNKRFNGGEDMVMADKVVGFACAVRDQRVQPDLISETSY